MSYQGKGARPMASESGRFFEVSKVCIGRDGHVTGVLWGEVHAGAERAVGARVVVTAADVVDAIQDVARVEAVFSPRAHLPERLFAIVLHEDGRECIALDDDPSPGRNLADLDSLDD